MFFREAHDQETLFVKPTGTRQGVIDTKRRLESLREMTFKETRGALAGAEKTALYAEIRGYAEEAARLERHLEEDFVPIHGPGQFLSPRAFFVCKRPTSTALWS